MVLFPKKETKCSQCVWSHYVPVEAVLACGYVCDLNPFRGVAMGLNGKHSKRKERIEEQKEMRKVM